MNGADFQISNRITTISASGMPTPATSKDLVVRNAIGASQPSTCIPNAFTIPYCGFSMVRQMVAPAITGSTYGTRNSARTTFCPRKGLRIASATITPPPITPIVVNVA